VTLPSAGWQDILAAPPLFTYSVRGVPLAAIIEPPVPDYREPLRLRLGRAFRHAGGIEEGLEGKVLVARPKSEPEAGAIYFKEGMRIDPGQYVLKVPLRLAGQPDPAAESEPVLRIEFHSGCFRDVMRSELSAQKMREFELACVVPRAQRYKPVVWWYGKSPVAMGDLTFVRKG